MTGSFSKILIESINQTKDLKFVIKIITEEILKGTRRSRYRGSSQEFSEYKAYYTGDEPRYIDWKVFGRTDRLYVKTFEEESKSRIVIWIDTSRSMFLNDSKLKFAHALTIAAVLSTIAAKSGETVRVLLFPYGEKKTFGGKITEIINFFEEKFKTTTPEGKVLWDGLLKELISTSGGKKTLYVLLSDFSPSYRQFSSGEDKKIYRIFPALKKVSSESKIFAVQIIEKSEFFLPRSDLLLVEPEDNARIKLDSSRADVIHQKMNERLEELKKWANRHASYFLRTTTDEHPARIIRKILTAI